MLTYPEYPIVFPENARSGTYREYIEKILLSGKCPFCKGGVTRDDQKTIFKNDHWWIIENRADQRIAGSKHHFLVIPQEHLQSMSDLTYPVFMQLTEALAWAKDYFGYSELLAYWREGDPALTGATVAHLHIQCIVPESEVTIYLGSFNPDIQPEVASTELGEFLCANQSWYLLRGQELTGAPHTFVHIPTSYDVSSFQSKKYRHMLGLIEHWKKIRRDKGAAALVIYWQETAANKKQRIQTLLPTATVALRFSYP